jgi:outer membrane murein-binding lipoprotein Lpp
MSKRALMLLFATGATISFAAGPASTVEDQQIAAAIQELRAQQAQIADNQAKVDAKLANISELVRQARLFASRARGQ